MHIIFVNNNNNNVGKDITSYNIDNDMNPFNYYRLGKIHLFFGLLKILYINKYLLVAVSLFFEISKLQK